MIRDFSVEVLEQKRHCALGGAKIQSYSCTLTRHTLQNRATCKITKIRLTILSRSTQNDIILWKATQARHNGAIHKTCHKSNTFEPTNAQIYLQGVFSDLFFSRRLWNGHRCPKWQNFNDSMIVPCGFFGFHQILVKKLFPLVFILVKVYVSLFSMKKPAFEDAKQADILSISTWPKQVKMGWKHLLGIPKEQLRQKIELIDVWCLSPIKLT